MPRIKYEKKLFDPDSVSVVLCPFTNQALTLKKLSNGSWQGAGAFYFTKLYDTKRSLLFDLLRRKGKDPSFDRSVTIEVKDREPPPTDPMADIVEGMKKTKDKADEFVDKLIGG
jgi:hypothetical protein